MTFLDAGAGHWVRLACAGWLGLALFGCSVSRTEDLESLTALRQTSALVEQVRAFSRTLGLESGGSFSRSVHDGEPLSILWLWLQREGTLALREGIDIRMAVGFRAAKEQIPLERVYRVAGYSVYFRQGNEFADPRALVTPSFAAAELVRRVNVIVHEDLHHPKNFDLPWEVEESIVTPLGAIIALEFFRATGNETSLRAASKRLEEERRLAVELNAIAAEAQGLFKSSPLAEARKEILAKLPSYSTYFRHFEHQIAGQNGTTVLEAKLSHDLAYYKHFDTIAFLAEAAPSLRVLIDDLKGVSRTWGGAGLEFYRRELQERDVSHRVTEMGAGTGDPQHAIVNGVVGR